MALSRTRQSALPASVEHAPATAFLLGLPYLADNELVSAARDLNAPILLSANALSTWKRDHIGVPVWMGFNTASLKHAQGLSVALDSAGFVAAAKYRRFPWSVSEYMDLCGSYPWKWFASMDMCVEPEIARSEDVVLNRISGTVRLNLQCANLAAERGIDDRLLPVVQGWRTDHYLRCIDRMGTLLDNRPIIGIGSMCRRHAYGQDGIIQILDALDRVFGTNPVRFHLFGVKSSALQLVASHPRVASADSQAYGIHARRQAEKIREAQPDFSKSNAFTAHVMKQWYREQVGVLTTSRRNFPAPTGLLDLAASQRVSPFEARIRATEENMRKLHEAGEISFGDLNPIVAFEAAFMDEDEPGMCM